MHYFSTNNKAKTVDFREATLKGQPADKGLYFPEQIPVLSPHFVRNIRQLSKEEVAFEVISPYIGSTIEENQLRQIIAETVAFDFPLVTITQEISALELFHGPTLAFKDVGARFMSRCLRHFARDADRKMTVLVATSGDTGGAVADAFYDVENINVVILYPSGKVSDIQELQLTTLGKNITALQIEGAFDDCQQMVRDAFADEGLNQKLALTSANSINIARWLPQQFYYFYAFQQWQDERPPVISVPSGNFGNICAGLLAKQSGLPVQHFVAACNANGIVSHYLATGKWIVKPSLPTLSNAMDVGNPNNFTRILQLFSHHYPSLKNAISSYTITDEQTIQAIREVKNDHRYLLDPHGAVGYVSLQHYLKSQKGMKGYFLATAHPIKFGVETIIGEKIELPDAVRMLLSKNKESIPMKADANSLKGYLLEAIQTK